MAEGLGSADTEGAAGLPAGTRVAHYRVDELIARGGMSAIYRATNLQVGQTVALKVLDTPAGREHVTRERFTHEWRAAAALSHPNILPVHDAGRMGDVLYMAMKLVEGGDLGALIAERGPLPPELALKLLGQAAAALDAAHAVGLVHRDFKPENLLLDGEHAYLADFGLSKLLRSDVRLTVPGRSVGTAAYLAPEQIRDEPVGPYTDVYALGCVVFNALTASSPFDAESDFVLLYAHLEHDVPRLTERRPELPSAVDEVVARAMHKDPEARYQSPGEAVAALRDAFGL